MSTKPKSSMGVLVGEEVDVIFTFPVAWIGWECDSKSWIVNGRKTGKNYLILTDHGGMYVGKKDELEARIKQYIGWIYNTHKALKYL